MTWYAIGKPGHVPRLLLEPESAGDFLGEVRLGEVAVLCGAPGVFTISESGDAVHPIPKTAEDELAEIRAMRDRLLAASDKYMLPDFPVSADAREEWAAYRQALRDITEDHPGTPMSLIEWPVSPTE